MEYHVTFRPAAAADVSLIAAIDLACGAPQDAHRAALVLELLGFGMSWLAEADGDAAGCALVSRRFFSRRFVELLAVAPVFRRQGLGTKLMAAARPPATARFCSLRPISPTGRCAPCWPRPATRPAGSSTTSTPAIRNWCS
jgi:GNAT superfamily N-acetyltransferase